MNLHMKSVPGHTITKLSKFKEKENFESSKRKITFHFARKPIFHSYLLHKAFSSFISNKPKLETTQMSNRQLGEQV